MTSMCHHIWQQMSFARLLCARCVGPGVGPEQSGCGHRVVSSLARSVAGTADCSGEGRGGGGEIDDRRRLEQEGEVVMVSTKRG